MRIRPKQMRCISTVLYAVSVTVVGNAATTPGVSATPSPLPLPDAPSVVIARMVEVGLPSSSTEFTVAKSAGDVPLSLDAHVSRTERFNEEARLNTECEEGTLRGKPCRVDWTRVLGSSLLFLAAQHGGNLWMDSDTRSNLTQGSFWEDYADCVKNYRWSRWRDDDPFGVDYIGHPMMGAMTSSIYEQNDPKQRALTFENTPRYWKGRLKAMAYSAAYSAQWKIGPASEASIGNTGIGYYIRERDGLYTNETGMQDFFVTPIGGLAWNVGEDLIDRYLFARVRSAHPHNKLLLGVASLMTPLKAGANAARFRALYYRDADRSLPGRRRVER